MSKQCNIPLYYSALFDIKSKSLMSNDILLTSIREVFAKFLHLKTYSTNLQNAPTYYYVIPKWSLGYAYNWIPKYLYMLANSAHPEREASLVIGWQVKENNFTSIILAISTLGKDRPRSWDTQVQWIIDLIIKNLPFAIQLNSIYSI